ncbi:MAG: hypothetical protein ACK5RT_17730 [Dolichospermum sp.]|nr:MAG: hypothetical protein AN485_02650 [Anabaena sp. MDT14b]QSV62190.1 MAG: hypothetical protein HEQ26_04885 [Dolichospermum sp. DL01]
MNDQLFSTLPGYTGSKETPCHQIKLQLKETGGCDRHNLRLLSKCPNCDARFKIPALWELGVCQRCLMTFTEMAESQKPVIDKF